MTLSYRKLQRISANSEFEIRPQKNKIDSNQFPFFRRLSLRVFVIGIESQTLEEVDSLLESFCEDSMIMLLIKDFNQGNLKMLGLCFQENLINKVHAVDESNVEKSLSEHKRLNNFISSEMKRLGSKLQEGGQLEENLEVWANRIIFFVQHSVILNNDNHFLVLP